MYAEEVHIRGGEQGGDVHTADFICLTRQRRYSTDNTDSTDSEGSADSTVLPINQLRLTNIELSALPLAKY
jgi:hypothetical protein